MSAFDKIIGYELIKEELKQIADCLKHTDKYRRMGVSIPRGLLLEGRPGVGKTLMATCLVEESGCRAFICRKDTSDGSFIKHIREIFEQAEENAPSVVVLDDMDKFADADRHNSYAEEYVTVQSCIDRIKGKDVFVIATVNDTNRVTESLIRHGRFDIALRIELSYLLGITNIHPAQTGFSTIPSDIAIETAWSDCSFDFTMAIAEPIRKRIQHRLDQRFGMVDDRIVSYSRIRLPQFHTLDTIGELAADSGVSFVDVDIENPKLIESVYNDICNLKFQREQCCLIPKSTLELARIYAYTFCGSKSENDFSAVKDFVFRDDIYKELVRNDDLPIGEINSLSCNCSIGDKKAKDIKLLNGYGVGERMISAYRKLHNQWYAADCLARVNMLLLIKCYSRE